jgi:hypothetical protein
MSNLWQITVLFLLSYMILFPKVWLIICQQLELSPYHKINLNILSAFASVLGIFVDYFSFLIKRHLLLFNFKIDNLGGPGSDLGNTLSDSCC